MGVKGEEHGLRAPPKVWWGGCGSSEGPAEEGLGVENSSFVILIFGGR